MREDFAPPHSLGFRYGIPEADTNPALVVELAARSDLPGHRANSRLGGSKLLLTRISREKDPIMSTTQVLEKGQEVTIPQVGKLLRVEQRSAEGEVLGVEYRRPADRKSLAIDPTLTSVVLVTADRALIAAPNLA